MNVNFLSFFSTIHEYLPQIPGSLCLWFALPIFVLTVFFNIWAVAVILQKEQNGMNQMIIYDCVAKIFCNAIILLIYGSPFSVHGSDLFARILCGFRSFLASILFSFNRLVPVGIVVFRYIMVCHAVSTVNFGGEKSLWKTVKWFILGLSLMQGVLMVFVLDDSLGFHKCIGKEEAFQ